MVSKKNISPVEWLHTKARIETEIKGNSKMAYEEGDLGTKARELINLIPGIKFNPQTVPLFFLLLIED